MRTVGLLLLTCGALRAQSTDEVAWPAFDLVSLKHDGSPHLTLEAGNGPVTVSMRPFKFLPTKVTCKMPLSAIIETAYGVKTWQLLSPEWVGSEKYDFAGLMPEGTSRETVRLMLRRTLAERFGLKLRREQKASPAYVLVVTAGSNKLNEVLPAPATYRYASGRDRVVAEPGMPLRVLADHLSSATGRPVIDETHLVGFYEIRLTWSWVSAGGEDDSGASGIVSALSQIGLKLVPEKRMIEYLIVERAEKEPIAN